MAQGGDRGLDEDAAARGLVYNHGSFKRGWHKQRTLDADRVKRAIKEAGLVQTEVADALMVSASSVSRWMNARRFPGPGGLMRLSKLLNLPPSDLVAGEELDEMEMAFLQAQETKQGAWTKERCTRKSRQIWELLRRNARLDTKVAKLAIKQAGLSQGQIAEALGVSRAVVSRWMHAGSLPKPKTLLELGKLLGLSIDDLITEETPPPLDALSRKPNEPEPGAGESQQKPSAQEVACLLLRGKRLDVDRVRQAMKEKGISLRAVRFHMGISDAKIANWMNATSFPNQPQLTRLGELLALSPGELVISQDPRLPRISFRGTGGTAAQNRYMRKARNIGHCLRDVAPYLPLAASKPAATLASPSLDYDCIRAAAAKLRKDSGLQPAERINFRRIIRRFGELRAVVVPVIWGSRRHHENAMHIHLPDTGSTWVYLNLDTNVHYFKFWVAHELGHCLAPSLEGDEAEDFADAFAAALLYPHELTEPAYASISAVPSAQARVEHVMGLAEQLVIPADAIMAQVNGYARATGRQELRLSHIYLPRAMSSFDDRHPNQSDVLFRDTELDASGWPRASEYIAMAERVFATPFFDSLGKCVREHDKDPSFVQDVLDLPLLDMRHTNSYLA